MTARFVHGEELSAEIKRVCKGPKGKFAVAFWGDGAVDGLYGDAIPTDAQIICDISMGGTNPDELEKLGATQNENLKYLDGLHAKVYLSEVGAVVGSANASENGVGFSGDAKHIEAGLELPPGTDAWKAASNWFDANFKGAHQVDEKAIEDARLKWNSRARGAASANTPPNEWHPGLLQNVISNPARFDGIGFVFTNEIDLAARDNAAEIEKKNTPADAELIDIWKKEGTYAPWGEEDVLRCPSEFINFHFEVRGALWVSAQRLERRNPSEGYIMASSDWRRIIGRIMPNLNEDIVRQNDKNIASKILGSAGGSICFSTVAKLNAFLDENSII